MKVLASKPGTPPAKIEKRTGDSIICYIDCQPLLSDKEIVYGKPLNSASELDISEVKVSSGKLVHFRISGGPTARVPYTDYSIIFTVNTTFKNVLTVPVTIRVYSN